MTLRGIRGAIQADANREKEIHAATQRLLSALLERNNVERQDIASVFLTCTVDLNAAFPAYAVREMGGWDQVPLLCAQEMEVPSGMPRVIRILLHVNTDKPQSEIRHVYLGATARLRPDLAEED